MNERKNRRRVFSALLPRKEMIETRKTLADSQTMTAARTQLECIIEILERDGQIDNFYAIHNRISLRLGARIWDLRQAGWQIETKELPDRTVYHVVKPPGAGTASIPSAR
jgi:hypothetical protein